MRKPLCLAVAAILLLSLSACSGDDDRAVVTGPGFVGIDDSTADTAPLLSVDYFDTVLGRQGRALILSDPLSDGDIAFNPVRSVFTITTSATPLFFGIHWADPDLSEFRAFLTFPLDGVTGQDIVPLSATISSATVELFITEVTFYDVVPTFMDLVQYRFQNLLPQDFNAAVIDFRTLDFLWSDPGNFVLIDVTPLMQTAQDLALLDFQIRFSVDAGAPPTGALGEGLRASSNRAVRTVSPSSVAAKRPTRNVENRETGSRMNIPPSDRRR